MMTVVMRCTIFTQLSVTTTDTTNRAKEGKGTIVRKTLGMQRNGEKGGKTSKPLCQDYKKEGNKYQNLE
jgi:hypothetical protein